MSSPETVVLSNGRLADGRVVDIHVTGGRITSVEDRQAASSPLTPAADHAHDLQGWLVLPAMAEPHAHLDKALSAERVPNPAGDLMGAITAWVQATDAGEITGDDIFERSLKAMEQLLVSGVTAVRTHVDVGAHRGTMGVDALVAARAELAGLIDVQIVALTHRPMVGDGCTGNRKALDAAIEAGIDLVGGCPYLDPDPTESMRYSLAVAADAGLDVDFHMDETLDPAVLTLRELARQVSNGFGGAVAASHCVSLGMQDDTTQAQVAAEVAAAGITVVTLPQTNLFLQGRDHQAAMPRGLTAIKALRDAGAHVVAGADNVQDPFNLVGRSDPLETAALMVMAGHQSPQQAYAMVSSDVRAHMGLEPVTVQPGDLADLVAIDAASVREAIADAPMSRRTFRRGTLVASVDHTATVTGR